MIAKNTTPEQLREALAVINKRFADNISFKRAPEQTGKRWTFTLRAIDSRKAGGRIGHTGRRIGNAACWHAHGYFFEALFKIAPDAVVYAGSLTISADAGNWQDRNIGSMVQPMMYSEACACEK